MPSQQGNQPLRTLPRVPLQSPPDVAASLFLQCDCSLTPILIYPSALTGRLGVSRNCPYILFRESSNASIRRDEESVCAHLPDSKEAMAI